MDTQELLRQRWDEMHGRRWIPVSERLPVDIPHGYCLVTDGTEVGTANYSKESGNWDHCIDRDYWKPTHWMPLPEPPEVKPAVADVISHAEPSGQSHASGQILGCLVEHDPYRHKPPEVK